MKTIRTLAAMLLVFVLLGSLTVAVGAKAPATVEGPCRANAGGFGFFYRLREIAADAVAYSANRQIESLVEDAQQESEPDIGALVAVTNAISARAIKLINLLGFDAECVYTEYVIDGETVLIDPIIVIKR